MAMSVAARRAVFFMASSLAESFHDGNGYAAEFTTYLQDRNTGCQ
jgi:hypothetical protein